MSDERLLDIETKLAYQEDLVDELNKIVTTQQSQLDELTEACRVLIERINELTDGGNSAAASSAEKPPHY